MVMNKTSTSITLETTPPVSVQIWEKHRKHFWRYDYDGCPKYGPFTSYQQALQDSLNYSKQ